MATTNGLCKSVGDVHVVGGGALSILYVLFI